MPRTALGHSHNGSRANGVSKKPDAKANGNAAILRRNGADHPESPPAKTNGAVPKGNGVLEDVSEGAVVAEENKKTHAKEPSSTARSENNKDEEGEEGANNASAREGRKKSSAQPPSSGPSK